jgi:8-oxo-dGTP pyrophosphatase MutT (NUDIX family)
VPAEIAANLRDFRRREIPPEGRRQSAVAVVVQGSGDDTGPDRDGDPVVLLTRRAPRLRAHAGQFALPGGRFDDGEDAIDAARRELSEELGVTAGRDQVAGLLDDYATRSGYVMTPVVFLLSAAQQPRPNPAEVAEVYTLTLGEIDVEPRFVTIPESDRPVIQLPLLGRFMHAPTAAILYQFREVALHGRATRVADYEQPVFAWR